MLAYKTPLGWSLLYKPAPSVVTVQTEALLIQSPHGTETEMEELASALTRAGISDPRLFKIRSSNYYIAAEGEKLVTEEQGEDSLVKAREDEDLSKSEKDSRCSRRVVHSLRAARPSDNRFLYVVGGREGRLRLRLGHTDPRHEGLGLFWKTEKFCESRLDFVYTFTNLKYNKSIGVKIEPTPTVTLLVSSLFPLRYPPPPPPLTHRHTRHTDTQTHAAHRHTHRATSKNKMTVAQPCCCG